MVDPSTIFIDGTHIKASANKKKYQKEQVKKAAKVYSGQLRHEVNAEREKLGKKPIEMTMMTTSLHLLLEVGQQKRQYPPQTQTVVCLSRESMSGSLPMRPIQHVTAEASY